MAYQPYFMSPAATLSAPNPIGSGFSVWSLWVPRVSHRLQPFPSPLQAPGAYEVDQVRLIGLVDRLFHRRRLIEVFDLGKRREFL